MNTNTPFDAAMAELFALGRFGIKLGLETISSMLEGIGNPHLSMNCIHVAGTNGKGSVAQSLAAILKESGCKVGVYTSPHLVDVNERFAIDGKPISNAQVLRAYEAVKKAADTDRQPTFFEYTTAMALHAFQEARVDWAVMETGMGGRLDATNVLRPKLCVITNLSVEHAMYLGGTIAKIAFEKGGIIKPGVPVVTGATQKSAVAVLENLARENKAPLWRLGRDFSTRRLKNNSFTYHGASNTWKNLTLALAGAHQVPNAALSLAGIEALMARGVNISEDRVRNGLAKVVWPGRLERACESPLVILDGAHNLAAMKVLTQYLEQAFKNRKITIIAGMLDDKPYAKMLPMLDALAERLIITRPEINRALEPKTLAAVLKPNPSRITLAPTVDKAVQCALDTAQPDGVIVIAGSLYVVGEARKSLAQRGLIKQPQY